MFEAGTINLGARKPEHEWVAKWDGFWMAAVPKVFEWLRWAVMLAAVKYVANTTEVGLLGVVVNVCFVTLFFYYQALFFQFRFEGLPFVKGEKAQRVVSLTLSGALAYGTWLLVWLSVEALARAAS